MSADGTGLTTRWLRLLIRVYPRDFREEMGAALLDTYVDRAREAARTGGRLALARVWIRALLDSLVNGVAERSRPSIAWRRAGDWGRDAEFVARRLRRSPLFATAVALTLTVGLGAFAAVYAAVHTVLIEPLPYDRPGDLYFAWRNYTWVPLERGWLAGTDVASLKAAGGPIEAVAGLKRWQLTLSQRVGGEPQQIAVMVSSANLFDLLGVQPIRGRGFARDEEGPGRPAVVVLGYDLWKGRFGLDPSTVGSEILLDGLPFKVIGVMGPNFHFVRHASLGPPEAADAYVTLNVRLQNTSPLGGSFAGLLRARPGASSQLVAAAVARVGAAIDERDFGKRGLRLYSVGLDADLVSRVRPALVLLGASAAGLVLMLGINLATLLLVRALQREREFAISRALGADRVALVRATLGEGALLGVLGGVGAVLAGTWATRALVSLAPLDFPRRESIAVDGTVGIVVVTVGLLLGLAAAGPPAIWATRAPLATLLAGTAARAGAGHQRWRRAMVVVQVALSLVLLCCGALLVRSVDRLLRANPGFDAGCVLTFRLPLPESRYREATAIQSLHERLQAGLAAVPGVVAVGAGSALPLSANADQKDVAFPGAPGNTGNRERDAPLVDVLGVRPGYFEALGIRVPSGRAFGAAAPAGMREAVIDRTLAARFFPRGTAIGATLTWAPNPPLTVVGVVEHARQYDVYRDGRPQVYVRSQTRASLSWAVRVNGSPLAFVPDVRRVVRQIDPGLALADVRTMDEVVGESLRQQRISAALAVGFAIAALLLAATGLFGVVSAAVTRRRYELAVRLALGAGRGQVIGLVFGEGALLILIGILLAIPGVYLAGRGVRTLLIGISPFDASTLAATAAGMALVALAACYIPARRVARIDPARSLRDGE